MEEQLKNNPLMCDPEAGFCEVPGHAEENEKALTHSLKKPIRLIYFTDPICSSCWGIEPQLRKLKMEYDEVFEIEYRMGGLLPDWSYNSGGISKPADVASHWDEAGRHYEMPIDGDLWLEDPLDSSYPPSIAFKAAQIQDQKKASLFLRRIKEMVFMEKKNISKLEHLLAAVIAADLDPVKFEQDFNGVAKEHFQEDLQLARYWNVRGFPTLFFTNAEGKSEKVYGAKPYRVFEGTIEMLVPGIKAKKALQVKDLDYLFSIYPTLTKKELAVIGDLSLTEAEVFLSNLLEEGKLAVVASKNGKIWYRKN